MFKEPQKQILYLKLYDLLVILKILSNDYPKSVPYEYTD